MRKFLVYFSRVIGVALLAVFIGVAIESKGDKIPFIIIGLILGVAPFLLKAKSKKQRQQEHAQVEAQRELIYVQSDLVSRGELVNIPTPLIVTKLNEAVHFGIAATLLITQNRAVGRTGGGSGVSFRVAKGVSVHTGRGSSRTVYRDITSRYGGMLFFTSQRVIFVNSQNGFEISLNKLTSFIETNGALLLQTGNKTYTIQTNENRLCIDTVHLILNKQKEAAQ